MSFECYYKGFAQIEPCEGTFFPKGYTLYPSYWASGRVWMGTRNLEVLADWLPVEEKRRIQRQARAYHLFVYATYVKSTK
jgi:hypothetical protein